MTTLVAREPMDRCETTITTFVVFDAASALGQMHEGETLELLTDDYEPLRRDVAAWCEAVGHRVRSCETVPGGLRFQIEKGPAKANEARLAVVISSDGLEELLSPLGFALAAALNGMAVYLYVQGPAVRVLRRGFRPKLRGWQRPFSRFAAAGLSRASHVSAQDKLRQLRALGAEIYVCGPSMQHFRVKPEDLIFPDLPVVEYFSFMAAMQRAVSTSTRERRSATLSDPSSSAGHECLLRHPPAAAARNA